jgi:hypothetical protein
MRIIPVITIKKCIQNRILKCGSDPKQVRRRGKGNDDNADLMCKPPREESNISIEEQTKKNPERPSNLPLRSWLMSIPMDSKLSHNTRKSS